MANVKEQPGAASGKTSATEEAKRVANLQRAEREREKQALNLQRENILSQKTSSPARRTALEAALHQIESQLAQMN